MCKQKMSLISHIITSKFQENGIYFIILHNEKGPKPFLYDDIFTGCQSMQPAYLQARKHYHGPCSWLVLSK